MRPDGEEAAQLRRYQALLAPGTGLRDGLERIVHGRTGALIVLGDSKTVRRLSTGGFKLDVEFSPTALRELAKLDGGIVVSSDLDRIKAAGVHFVPDGSLPTLETGTRHRSADRVAQEAGIPVVTVSASMATIALFMGGQRYLVDRPEVLLGRANQALAAMRSYRERLQVATRQLSTHEIQDTVTTHEVATVAQRLEMVQRLQSELADWVSALGVEGRLLQLQLHELSFGLDELGVLLTADYAPAAPTVDGGVLDETPEVAPEVPPSAPPDWTGMAGLGALDDDELLNLNAVARVMGFAVPERLDTRVSPRGYRQLASVPRLSPALAQRVLEHFGSFQALLGATTVELLEVDGVGEQRARAIREGLLRLVENPWSDAGQG